MLSDENRDMLGAMFIIVLLALLFAFFSQCQVAKADYVIAFTAPDNCHACQVQQPAIDKVRAEGVDIREVDPFRYRELRRHYGVTRIPTFAYVVERDGLSYDSGLRLYYPVTTAQLRYFARQKQPYFEPAPVANIVRGIFGLPPIIVTW